MKWISSFAKHGQDETVVGYNLSFVPAYAANASVAGRLGANGSWSGDGGNGGDGGRHMEVSTSPTRTPTDAVHNST